MNFVIISLSPWDMELGSNIRDIATVIAQEHKVLFVNIPLKRSEYLRGGNYNPTAISIRREVIRKKRQTLFEISENLWQHYPDIVIEPINRLKPNFLFDGLNKMNAKRYFNSVNKDIERLGFDDYILLNDNDIYNGVNIRKHLKASRFVYYLRDKLSAMKYWQSHALRLEEQLIGDYDLTLTNSVYLKEYALEIKNNAEYVGQGCDLTAFSIAEDTPVPADMSTIRKPIIGYAGALNSQRLDMELIDKLAVDNPQWNFVYIGHPDKGFSEYNFSKSKNLHFLGSRKMETLPVYLNAFDVCINPQLLNELTIGNYPRKIDEYLAVGKPVVATKTVAMGPFEEVCMLATDVNDYVESIKEALESDNDTLIKTRKEFAAEHTWENSVAKIVNYINAI
jgi:glycosyltransferase involved in cell wall biosynthesis